MSPTNLSRAGTIGAVAGLLGAALAILILGWPERSTDDLFRHPFTTTEFLFFQAAFFVQHAGLVVLLVALARSGAAQGRVFRLGSWLAVAGMVVFCLAELLAMAYADTDRATADAGAIGTAYGLASVVNGLGLVVAGAVVGRAHGWTVWRRWSPLATGACLFVVVIPGLFGTFVAGRLVIAVWMLFFAALGWSLRAEVRATQTDASRADDRVARAAS